VQHFIPPQKPNAFISTSNLRFSGRINRGFFSTMTNSFSQFEYRTTDPTHTSTHFPPVFFYLCVAGLPLIRKRKKTFMNPSQQQAKKAVVPSFSSPSSTNPSLASTAAGAGGQNKKYTDRNLNSVIPAPLSSTSTVGKLNYRSIPPPSNCAHLRDQ
jgi:hypothetical protein